MGREAKSMEIKKPQQAANRQFSFKRMQESVTEIRGEIDKITWTSREELLFYTKLVVGATFVFGMAIYTWDLFTQTALSALSFLLHLIGG